MSLYWLPIDQEPRPEESATMSEPATIPSASGEVLSVRVREALDDLIAAINEDTHGRLPVKVAISDFGSSEMTMSVTTQAAVKAVREVVMRTKLF